MSDIDEILEGQMSIDDLLDDVEDNSDIPEVNELYKMDTLGDLSKALYKIRNERDRVRAIEKDLNQKKEITERLLLDKLDEAGINSVKTDYGTVTKKVSLYPRVADLQALGEWIQKTGRIDIMQKRVSKGVFTEVFESTGEYPSGVDAYDKETISFRKSK